MNLYLVLYNALTFCGWVKVGYTLYESVTTDCSSGVDIVPGWLPESPLNGKVCVFHDNGPDGNYLLTQLQFYQTGALLEVLHAALKIVPSNPVVVFQQVLSRILQVWLIFTVAPEQTVTMPAMWLMAFAWSLTEVIRYSLYTMKQLGMSAPFVLEYCRLTFFIVLYPIGVYGENMCQYRASQTFEGSTPRSTVSYKWFVYLCMSAYPFLFPGLYMHMFKQRNKFLKGPVKKEEPKPEAGVQFPDEDKDAKGKRSTSITGAKIYAAAFKGSASKETIKLAEPCEKAGKKWRFGYLKHLTKLVKACSESNEEAVAISKAGLDYIYKNFEFYRKGKATKFVNEMKTLKAKYNVGVIEGKGAPYNGPYKVPYQGSEISGDALKAQCDKWVAQGVIEQDCGDAIKQVVDNPKLTDLKGQTFVLLGAGSAMGPFPKLMELGATVVALDIPGNWGVGTKRPSSGCWKRLVGIARESPGTLIFPMTKLQTDCKDDMEMFEASGANLMEEPAEILEFLLKDDVIGKKGKKATIGNYTYLNSDLHVKLSLCSDAIISGLIERKGADISIAFLCTPTDLHVIPEEAYTAAKANASPLANPPAWILHQVIKVLTGFKSLKSNAMKPVKTSSGDSINLVNGVSVAQGPNYALAKRMQHWRAVIAFNEGCTVSSNIAPSTATISVLQNKMFALAYKGMPFFKPYEIFEQETTNAVMGAMLFHDINNDKGSANPKNREEFKIDNALKLFKYGSFHGGLWRCGYTVESVGLPSIIVACLGGPALFMPVMYTVLGGLGYFFQSPYFLESSFVADMITLFSF